LFVTGAGFVTDPVAWKAFIDSKSAAVFIFIAIRGVEADTFFVSKCSPFTGPCGALCVLIAWHSHGKQSHAIAIHVAIRAFRA
jgi:hypothetical protein